MCSEPYYYYLILSLFLLRICVQNTWVVTEVGTLFSEPAEIEGNKVITEFGEELPAGSVPLEQVTANAIAYFGFYIPIGMLRIPIRYSVGVRSTPWGKMYSVRKLQPIFIWNKYRWKASLIYYYCWNSCLSSIFLYGENANYKKVFMRSLYPAPGENKWK